MNCKAHGEVEAEPDGNGDVICPICVKQAFATSLANSMKVNAVTWTLSGRYSISTQPQREENDE